MTTALALLVGALVAGWLVPRQLSRADLRRLDPAPVIVSWLLSIAGFLLAGAVGVALLLIPDHGTPGGLAAAMHQCWIAVQHGSLPRLEELGGVLGLGLLISGLVRFTVVGVIEFRQRLHARREQVAVLRLAARTDEHAPSTLWLAHDRPLAFSIAGRPGVVVATDGLRRCLSADGVAAVLAHEQAHLRGRHHLLVAIVEVLGKTLPFVPLFRQAPGAMRELVELAADVEAVRRHGNAAVRSALLGVTGTGAPHGALAMARDAVSVRLEHLRLCGRPPRRVGRTLSCGFAGIGAAALPFLTGASLLLAAAVVGCSGLL
ncbi:MAG: M56 family metallopeptidase [Pseudonocardiaceae bacterium]